MLRLGRMGLRICLLGEERWERRQAQVLGSVRLGSRNLRDFQAVCRGQGWRNCRSE